MNGFNRHEPRDSLCREVHLAFRTRDTLQPSDPPAFRIQHRVEETGEAVYADGIGSFDPR